MRDIACNAGRKMDLVCSESARTQCSLEYCQPWFIKRASRGRFVDVPPKRYWWIRRELGVAAWMQFATCKLENRLCLWLRTSDYRKSSWIWLQFVRNRRMGRSRIGYANRLRSLIRIKIDYWLSKVRSLCLSLLFVYQPFIFHKLNGFFIWKEQDWRFIRCGKPSYYRINIIDLTLVFSINTSVFQISIIDFDCVFNKHFWVFNKHFSVLNNHYWFWLFYFLCVTSLYNKFLFIYLYLYLYEKDVFNFYLYKHAFYYT